MFRKINKDLIKSIKKCRFHGTKINLNKFKDTVLLPKTKFPQKLVGKKITEQNKFIFEKCGFNELYVWQQNNLKNEFILHDGPPYANGVPHMGHAVNKILKDVINRRNIIVGRKINFRPGWDCHGLPIELKALSQSKNIEKTPLNIRKIARDFARETIKKQQNIFESWGVTADWKNPYLTYNVSYIENQLRKFYELYEKKLIYRDLKPVYWSPSSRTALAEAELEYNENHKSTAIIVRFKLSQIPDKIRDYIPGKTSQIYALIWTTTPWTLPSNQAICYNPNISYSFAKTDSNIYLIATDLIESVSKLIDKPLEIITSFSGDNLKGAGYQLPFGGDEIFPFLSGDHATATKGTGLVHTAPAHGPDDFVLALNHKIPIKCVVDESGCYTQAFGQFAGLNVLTNANTAIIEHLKEDLLSKSEYIHSYPYDWRTKKPVIIRASEQWFIDTNSIKNRAIELLDSVKIYPEKNGIIYKNNFINQLKRRPFWCISRQRLWGVPIPVFFDGNKNPVVSKKLIEHLIELLRENGPDFWWKLQENELISKEICEEFGLKIEEIEKGKDILDIWYDSGMSWSSVLGDEITADLYLEGVDQFTGWFQSSLITSVALRDKVPFKNIYVHGFVVDENGRKMSKSLGNVTDPQDIINGAKKQPAHGVDTLRWWVVCHASQNPTESISQNVLKSSSDEIQKIRNTLRFALSNLNDEKIEVNHAKMRIVDKYMLHLLYEFEKQISEMFENFEFNKICLNIIRFLTNPVSAFYFTIIKDRLYCDSRTNNSRRDAQFILESILNVVSKICAPIIPHLIEELYYFREYKTAETFYKIPDKNWMKPEFHSPEIAQLMEEIFEIKREVHKINNFAEAEIELKVSEQLYERFEMFGDKQELIELLQVADVVITRDVSTESFEIIPKKTEKYVCLRCKRFNSDVFEELCGRCVEVVENKA